jgi:hypothetical protein
MRIIQLHVTIHKTAKAIGINIDSINTLSTLINISVIFIIGLGTSAYTILIGAFDGVCDGVAVDVFVAKLLYELKGESVKYDDIVADAEPVAELVAVETS